MMSGLGPSLAAIAVVTLHSDRGGLREWLLRCLQWRRIGWRWYMVAFGLPPVLMALALALEGALGGAIPVSPASGHVGLAVVNFGLVLLVGGPLGEEFGWRGYALPAMAAVLKWRAASLLIGVIWGLWHLPLFFMNNTPQSHIPVLLFLASTIAASVILGWISVNTDHSVVPALIMHTSINGWVSILPVLPTANTFRPLALMIGAQVLIAMALLFRASRRGAPGDSGA